VIVVHVHREEKVPDLLHFLLHWLSRILVAHTPDLICIFSLESVNPGLNEPCSVVFSPRSGERSLDRLDLVKMSY
jgi:hypothetical protein